MSPNTLSHRPESNAEGPRRYAMISTLPPTACGLATFGAALSRSLATRPGVRMDGIRVIDSAEMAEPTSSRSMNWFIDREDSLDEVIECSSAYDGVFIQHEYGIFGPNDGSAIVDLLEHISVPSITTLHTVPLHPSPNQRHLLEAVVDRSSFSVTMTKSARSRLVEMYDVDASKVACIPHGASIPSGAAYIEPTPYKLLTWGLIGPGKGIEHVIEAIALLVDAYPEIEYVVAGATHPKVLAREGEKYRDGLIDLAERLGVSDHVVFDPHYRTLDELDALVLDSELVVLPYDSPDQITSGVLVDAVTAGRPVLATDFPHARELSRGGAVRVVPRRTALELARGMDHILGSRSTRTFMRQAARRLAPQHSWPNVARSYTRLMRSAGSRQSRQFAS